MFRMQEGGCTHDANPDGLCMGAAKNRTRVFFVRGFAEGILRFGDSHCAMPRTQSFGNMKFTWRCRFWIVDSDWNWFGTRERLPGKKWNLIVCWDLHRSDWDFTKLLGETPHLSIRTSSNVCCPVTSKILQLQRTSVPFQCVALSIRRTRMFLCRGQYYNSIKSVEQQTVAGWNIRDHTFRIWVRDFTKCECTWVSWFSVSCVLLAKSITHLEFGAHAYNECPFF